jgi:O-antigen/teichoic acid export membrane protein
MRHNCTAQPALPYAPRGRRNVVWSALDYGAVPLGMLIATPIFIHYLGLEQYGVLVLVTALVGFSALFNLGFGDTALKYVSHYSNLGDRQRAGEIVRTIGSLTLGSGFFIRVLFVFATPLTTVVFNLDSLPNPAETLYPTALIRESIIKHASIEFWVG